MDKLIKYCNTGDIISAESFRSLALILSSPAALLVLRPRSWRVTNSVDTWFSENLLFYLGSTSTSSPEEHIAFASFCPIVEKCLFSASAISLGWRRNVFLSLIALTSEQFLDGSVCLKAFHILLLSDLFSSIKLRKCSDFRRWSSWFE